MADNETNTSEGTLEKFVGMSPKEQEEFMKTDEFKRSRRKYGFLHPLQRKTYGDKVTLFFDRRTY